jgi:hypothetical protein
MSNVQVRRLFFLPRFTPVTHSLFSETVLTVMTFLTHLLFAPEEQHVYSSAAFNFLSLL